MVVLSSLICLAGAQGARSSSLALQPKGAVAARLGYFPVPIPLSDVRPPEIKKEPEYRTKPKYGVIHLGNGPKGDYAFALDEPAGAEFKIYIDRNRDGDLTRVGNGDWPAHRTKGREMYGVMEVTLRASYGTKTHQTSSAEYVLGLYRFPGMAQLFSYRQTAHVGRVTVDGKAHNALLVENDANALFTKDSKRPLWLQVDVNNDGKPETVDARAPFNLAGKAYEAMISPDGFNISIQHTSKVVMTPKAPPPSPPLLKPGTAAPAFSAEKWGGGTLSLADYKGKIVILDFWATWCGPCQRSMPHIEKVYKTVQGQDVVVVGVCVWDEKAAYSDWVPKNQDKYTFQLAFDPAGRGENNIARKFFNVTGIPTTYVIGKDGNVVDSVVGYDDGDTRLEAVLRKLGVKI